MAWLEKRNGTWFVCHRDDLATGQPFQEVVIQLGEPDSTEKMLQYSPSARVPLLMHGELSIWDSLAICEYLAETFPEARLWPEDKAARAVARAVTAEMHSGFTALRNHMSMNIRARKPGQGREPLWVPAPLGREHR